MITKRLIQIVEVHYPLANCICNLLRSQTRKAFWFELAKNKQTNKKNTYISLKLMEFKQVLGANQGQKFSIDQVLKQAQSSPPTAVAAQLTFKC